MSRFDLWELMKQWPGSVDLSLVLEAGRLEDDDYWVEVDWPLSLEPEDIDFWTGMPMSVPYCLRRPD